MAAGCAGAEEPVAGPTSEKLTPPATESPTPLELEVLSDQLRPGICDDIDFSGMQPIYGDPSPFGVSENRTNEEVRCVLASHGLVDGEIERPGGFAVAHFEVFSTAELAEEAYEKGGTPTSDVLTGLDQLAVDQATSTAWSGNVKIMMVTENVYIEVEITTPGGTEALGDLADQQRSAAIQLAQRVVAAMQSQADPVR